MSNTALITPGAVMAALAAPFSASEVRYKPAIVKGERCLAMAYVDARTIMDRLDAAVGVGGWSDDYDCLPDGSVVCRLRLLIGGEWVSKTDVGGQSEQPDEGDRRKAAFSDALKRAAVKFGIGRYLYRLEPQWVGYDPKTKRIVAPPVQAAPVKPVARIAAKPAPPPAPAKAHPLPENGMELKSRLTAYDGQLAAKGACQRGELLSSVVAAGMKAGYPADLAYWSGPAISLAVEECRAFETRIKAVKS